jgi:hypothetical protein
MRQFPAIVFFRIREGYGGHTTILALFDRDGAAGIERSTLDHLAFTIDVADYEAERDRLEAAGLNVRPEMFEWVGWRRVYPGIPRATSQTVAWPGRRARPRRSNPSPPSLPPFRNSSARWETCP